MMNPYLDRGSIAKHGVSGAVLLALSACGGGSSGGAPAATATITVSPASIAIGQTATLTWSSSYATGCTASGAWSGSQATSGSQSLTPSAAGTSSYSLVCTGAGGASSTASATLTVTGPSSGPYTLTALIADAAGTGALTHDANLVNPWGIAAASDDAMWVANNHTDTSTIYDGNGKAQPVGTPLVVAFPNPGTATFDPTGIAANEGSGFVVTSGAKSGAARYVFVGEGGAIAGWTPAVDAAHAVIAYTDANGAVYKGLTLAGKGGVTFLYAADFHNGKVDVFDTSFHKQTPSAGTFAFTDSTLPVGYAPFNIQALPTGAAGTTQLYVSYAKQQAPDNHDEMDGAGLGLVDVFDTNGTLLKHLILTGGALNAPWGIALAPSDFGGLSGDLLVGNFGDGRINAFDAGTGKFVAALTDANGHELSVPGLWGIAFGNDHANQPHNTLFVAAGPNKEAAGAYGRIDVGATAPVLNKAPGVAITAPVASGGVYGGGGSSLSGTVTVTATATGSVDIAKVQFFVNGTTLIGTATSAPYSVQWNTATVANGAVNLTAVATDIDGNVGTSAKDTVSVSNASPPPPAATLTELQSSIFGPICSGCHNGVGSSLPGVQDLTSAAKTHASVVGVASIEQPALEKVKPGDPANSYLVQKLQGAATITGSRMPLGGPYLSAQQISQIQSWISAGAPNN